MHELPNRIGLATGHSPVPCPGVGGEGTGTPPSPPAAAGAPGADMGTNGPCVRARCRKGRTFGMHLDDSAQRTNFTCPRDFGGLLRPVARLFLVMTGELGLLQTGDERHTIRSAARHDPRTTEDYGQYIHERGEGAKSIAHTLKGQTHQTPADRSRSTM